MISIFFGIYNNKPVVHVCSEQFWINLSRKQHLLGVTVSEQWWAVRGVSYA